MIDFQTVGVVIAIAGSIAGLLKYVFYLLDKHEKHTAGRFKDHNNKIEKNTTDIRINEKSLNETRDEMHKDYIHKDDYKDDLKNMTETASDNFRAIFKKLDGMAKNLNQLIGAHNGKVESKIEKQNDDKD